jgi:outer membrane protein assembly factor BamB
MRRFLSVFMLLLAGGMLFADSYAWPRWRGPNGDGTSVETGWNPAALKGGAKVLWNVDIGVGYSNIVIQDNRLYAMGKDRKTLDFAVTCLDTANGKVIWKNTKLRAVGEVKSTPVVDGDKVYGLGSDGALFCLRASDGEVVWQKNLEKDFGVAAWSYGWASSPVIEGGALLLNANSAGMALKKETGDLLWLSGAYDVYGPQSSYATPVVLGSPGARNALFYGPEQLSEVDIATGKVLWQYPHEAQLEVVADPVVSGDQVFYATLEGCGVLERVEGSLAVMWKGGLLKGGIYSYVAVNGYLYGTDWASLINNWDWAAVARANWPIRCVELKTGKELWNVTMKPVALMAADGKLIMLELNGTLHIAKATPEGFTELSSADVLGGANKSRIFPTAPVLCGGRIYCRNYAGDLICIDVSK